MFLAIHIRLCRRKSTLFAGLCPTGGIRSMKVTNVRLHFSPVNAKIKHREDKVVKTELTAFGQMLIAYTLATAALFAAFTVMFGFKATLWGSAILFSSCTLGFFAMWWQEEHQLPRVPGSNDPFVTRSALVASPAADPSGQPNPSSILWPSKLYPHRERLRPSIE